MAPYEILKTLRVRSDSVTFMEYGAEHSRTLRYQAGGKEPSIQEFAACTDWSARSRNDLVQAQYCMKSSWTSWFDPLQDDRIREVKVINPILSLADFTLMMWLSC